jgi:Na+/pantothenate symporter
LGKAFSLFCNFITTLSGAGGLGAVFCTGVQFIILILFICLCFVKSFVVEGSILLWWLRCVKSTGVKEDVRERLLKNSIMIMFVVVYRQFFLRGALLSCSRHSNACTGCRLAIHCAVWACCGTKKRAKLRISGGVLEPKCVVW